MKTINQCLVLTACAVGVLAFASHAAAGPTMSSGVGGIIMTPIGDTNTNGIPDRLKTCPVSGDKLGDDMGAPFVFSYKGQEVKLCCKSCKKDFDKNPDKYLKLIRAADPK